MHPVLFTILGQPVHLYAVAIAAGFIVGIWLSARHAERVGIDRDMVLDLCWWLIVMSLVGARVGFIAVEWEQYYWPCVDYEHFNTLFPDKAITAPDCTRLLRFWTGGLVFYGGVIGAMLAMVWYLRREKHPILPVADALVPLLALGQFFGRLGCWAAGCCWGAVTQASYGVEFPRGSQAFRFHVEEGLITKAAEHSHTVHAVQLYDALGGLLLFGLLLVIRHRKRYHGQVFIWWMMLYPLMRSTMELFRGDTERGFVFEWPLEGVNRALGLAADKATLLSTSQFISVGFTLVGIALLVYQRAQRRRSDA